MYAVVGTWSMDPARSQEQEQALRHIVDGVRRLPGFVRGFWSRDVDEPEIDVTYVVFEQLEQARAFRAAVEANSPRQADLGVHRDRLRLLEVRAET